MEVSNMKNISKIIIVALSLFVLALSCFSFQVSAITPNSSDISPTTFSPGDGNGINDTCTITVTYTPSQNLYVNIFNQSSASLEAEDRAMTESPSGTYVYTWNGKNDSNSYVPDGTYTIRVSSNPSSNGDTIGTVQVNTTAPSSPSLSVEGGNTYTTSRSVNLTISATGATKMKVSNYADFTGATWENYATTKTWQLSSSDGTKTVYINFKTTSGANVSKSDSIILDTTLADPTLSINSGATSTNSRDLTLTITANGATKMKIDNDTQFSNMSSWLNIATSYNFTVPQGESNPTVYLRIKDAANNQKTTSDSIVVDTTAPTNLSISINSGASYTNSSSVSLALSANGGPTTMYLSNNGVTWTSYSYATSKTWSLSDNDGSKTVYFKARDSAGNNATAITSSITLDTTAPSQVTLSSPAAGATVSSQTPTFTWTNPNNASHTRTFKIEILQSGSIEASANTNSSTTTYTAETLSEGVYTWRITVYDMANNTAVTSQRSFTISIDGLPVPSQTYPANNAYVNMSSYTNNQIKLQCSPLTSEDTVYYDFKYGLGLTNQNRSKSSAGNTPEISITTSYSNGQTIYWSVRARNNSGSTAYSTNRSFTIDTQAPTLNSISINSGATYTNSSSVTLTLSATGASWMKLSNYAAFTNASWQAYSTSKSITLLSGDGVKTVYFKAKDAAVGNQGTSYPNINNTAISDTITLDTAGPTISNGIPSSSTTDTTPQISAEFTDSLSGSDNTTLVVKLDGTNVTANATIYSGQFTYTPSTALSTGSHTVNVSVEDAVGNIGYLEWSFTITSTDDSNDDSSGTGPGVVTPPSSTISFSSVSYSPTTVTSSDKVNVTATATPSGTVTIGRVSVYYTHSDGTSDLITMTNSADFDYYAEIGPFDSGTITFYIKAVDTSSNSYQSTNESFTITDNDNPSITIVSPLNGSTINDLTPVIRADFSDSGGIDTSSVKIIFAGKDVTDLATVSSTSVSYMPEENLTYSTYAVSVEVKDNSGNKESVEWSFSIVADTEESKYVLDDILEGETLTWENTQDSSSINKISITASNDMQSPELRVVTTGSKPDDISNNPSQLVYMYLVIETDKNSTDVESATIQFKVSKSWLEINKIDSETIKLLRYTENGWESLETTKVAADNTHIHYKAITSGFSSFAIVGDAQKEVAPEINWFIILGGVVFVIIMVIAILFKTGHFYVEDKNKNNKK